MMVSQWSVGQDRSGRWMGPGLDVSISSHAQELGSGMPSKTNLQGAGQAGRHASSMMTKTSSKLPYSPSSLLLPSLLSSHLLLLLPLLIFVPATLPGERSSMSARWRVCARWRRSNWAKENVWRAGAAAGAQTGVARSARKWRARAHNMAWHGMA